MILRLRVENWGNVERREVEFKEGFNLIFGPNYFGKSSLLNAIFYALVGGLPYKSLSPGDMVRKGAKEASIELDFMNVEGNAYRVRRILRAGRKKSNAFLYPLVDGEEREEIESGHDRVTQKILEILGVGKKYFLRAVFMREGDVYRFLTSPERGIQDEFNEILGIGKIVSIMNSVSEVKRELDRKVKDLEKEIASIEKVHISKSFEELSKELRDIESEINRLNSEIEALEGDKEKYEGMLKVFEEAEELESDLEKLKGEMENLTRGIPGEGGYETRLNNFLRMKEEEFNVLEKRVTDLRDDIKGLESKIEDLNEEIKKLSGVTAICPTCERPLTREEAEKVIEKKRKRIEELNTEISEKEKSFEDEKRKLDELRRLIDDLKGRKRELSRILELVKDINRRKAELKQRVKMRKSDVEKRLREISVEIEEKEKERDKLLTRKGAISKEIEMSKIKLDDLKKDLRNFVHKHHVTELFIRACDATAKEISKSALDRVKREVADIWGRIRGGVWEVDWDERLFLTLRSLDKEFVIEQLSGAEKILLSIALRVALAKYLGNPGFLIFDEPVEHLDETNKEYLKEILLKFPRNAVRQLIVASCDRVLLDAEWDNVIDLSSM